MSRRFLLFALIGGLAFLVDAGLYFLLGGVLHLPWLQKALGFAGGVSTTYCFNSVLTFRVPLSLSRYGLYVLSQAGGMAVNMTAFLLALRVMPALLALMVATLVGLGANFLAARRVLSQKSRHH